MFIPELPPCTAGCEPSSSPSAPGGSASIGASLVELLVALGLSILLSTALLSWVWSYQQWSGRLSRALERDENLRLAPVLLAGYLSGAGNQRWRHGWPGLEWTGAGLHVQADIEGPNGFPDGKLEGRFERFWLRQQGHQFRLRSGRGGYQPLLTRVSGWAIDRPTSQLLKVSVQGRALAAPGQSRVGLDESLQLEFFLPNFRSSLFPEEP